MATVEARGISKGFAGRSVLAHLIDLAARGVVARDGDVWRLA